MIANATELEVACRNLKSMERALAIIQAELMASNPGMFPLVSTGYTQRIADLQEEITEYLCAHPTDVSSLLRPDFAVVPAEAVSELRQAL